MPYLNSVLIVGHLTRDAEVAFAQSGTAYAKFSVYTKESIKKNGQWEKETTFHDCVCFGKPAEWLGNAHKGQLVVLTGRIQKRKWQDKEGNNRISVEIICDSVQVMKDREESGSSGGSSEPAFNPDDDIPF